MKLKNLFFGLLYISSGTCTYAQSMSLNPAVLSPNIITITAVNAGALPADPMVSNSSQSLVYIFRRLGGWGSQALGYIDVNCWYIPTGFQVFTRADNNTGPGQKNGIASGLINVNSTYQNLIYNIKTTDQVSRVLTMSVQVTDFSQLAIGEFQVTVNYRMSY